jgi:glycosyltransferase involved in cell wall biosynthesis
VKNGESGFVVPPGDSDALAKAMLRVEMLDPSSRHQMGEVARARVVAEFSLSAVVDRWEALYRQLAG